MTLQTFSYIIMFYISIPVRRNTIVTFETKRCRYDMSSMLAYLLMRMFPFWTSCSRYTEFSRGVLSEGTLHIKHRLCFWEKQGSFWGKTREHLRITILFSTHTYLASAPEQCMTNLIRSSNWSNPGYTLFIVLMFLFFYWLSITSGELPWVQSNRKENICTQTMFFWFNFNGWQIEISQCMGSKRTWARQRIK